MAPSDSNKKNPDKQMQEQVKEHKEEMALFDGFKRIATSKLERMARQSEESGMKYKMGDTEKQVLSQMHGMGLKEGIAAGVVTFFALRRGPIYIGRWVQRRRLQSQQQQSSQGMTPPDNKGTYQLSDPNATRNNPFQRASNPEFPRSKSIVRRSIWFMFDSVISLMMAASVSMAFTDTDKIRQQLLELPLIPGRSLTADALCSEIVDELQKVQQKHNPAYERLQKINSSKNKTPASSYLEGIVAFSENCQRRQFMERRLRQERGLGKDDKVEIPDPGVPRDGPRLITNSEGEESEADDTFATETGFHDEMNWVTDFVTDQEEDQKRR
jgi:hypothetical protein